MAATNIKLKVFVAGPQRVGKSVIANLLANVEQSSLANYKPTKGVRILEFDRMLNSPKLNGTFKNKTANVSVEIWDCSGDPRCMSLILSVARDCQGVLLVVNPDVPGQERELEAWCKQFPALREQQYQVFAQKQSNPSQSRPRLRLGKPLSRVPVIFTSIEGESEVIRKEFDAFLVIIANAMIEKNEKDENAVLSMGSKPIQTSA